MSNILNNKLKQRITLYPYQEVIVSDIMNHFGMTKPYVLGSCPSSGKTEMAIETIIRLMELGKIKNVLVLAHSTNVLKTNFYERLLNYFNDDSDLVEIMSTKYGRAKRKYNYNATIQVMIHQNIKHVKKEFDLVIVDEAHHNVLAEDGNYSKIIEKTKPKFQLMLTGTPSKFIRENDLVDENEPYHINCVGMDKIGLDNFHDVRFDLIKSKYNFTNSNYNQSHHLLENTKFHFKDTERTINNVIYGVVKNVALRHNIELSHDADFTLEGRKMIKDGKFGKTLIMCRNIEQANQISKIISKAFDVKVFVSESKHDIKSKNLDDFKDNKFDFLCVVNRAREGFDDKDIINLIDLTMTHNIDLIYQMFCRVIRLNENHKQPKLYIKVTSSANKMPEYTMNIMTASLMLGATKNLYMFNGINFRNIIIPKIQKQDVNNYNIHGKLQIINEYGKSIKQKNINDLMALDLIQMFVEDEKNLIDGNERYAMITLGESIEILRGNVFDVSTIEECITLANQNGIKSASQWTKRYKEIGEKEILNLPSNPWSYFNLKGGKKEFSKLLGGGRNYGVLSINSCITLANQNDITSSMQWRLRYKEIGEKENLKLPAKPWRTFKLEGGEKEFTKLLGGSKIPYDVNSIDECVKLALKYDVPSANAWMKRCKEIGEKENLNLPFHPWNYFKLKGGLKEFSNLLGNKRLTYGVSSIDECVTLAIENDIKTASQWTKRYKEIGEKENLKLPINPWNSFNLKGGKKEFSKLLGGGRNYGVLFINDCVILAIENDIKTASQWVKRYKEIGEKENLNLPSTPWGTFNLEGGGKEFTKLLKEEIERKKLKSKPTESIISRINQMGKISLSQTMHKYFKANPEQFNTYQILRDENEEYWEESPVEEIAKQIIDNKKVIDFGCGSNKLKRELPNNEVTPIDHIAFDDSVIACDMSDISKHVKSETHDVAVFSLSLWGTKKNKQNYLNEAFRVLKKNGLVHIVEPIGRIKDSNKRKDKLIELVTNSNFKIVNINVSETFMYFRGIKI